jgi:hypothetical protein
MSASFLAVADDERPISMRLPLDTLIFELLRLDIFMDNSLFPLYMKPRQ